MLGVDPRRFGPYADTGYLIENKRGGLRQGLHRPLSRRGARGLRARCDQTPCYSRMKDLGAVFGSVYGWERPNWFAPQGYGLSEADLALKPDVLLNENHPPAGAGREAAREMELSPFELFSIRRRRMPKRARECRPHGYVGLRQVRSVWRWARRVGSIRSLTNRAPKTTGRVTLSYLLTERGGVRAEFTLTRIGPDRFYLISAGRARNP